MLYSAATITAKYSFVRSQAIKLEMLKQYDNCTLLDSWLVG